MTNDIQKDEKDKDYDFLIKSLNHKHNAEDKINLSLIEHYPNCSSLFNKMIEISQNVNMQNINELLSVLHSLKGHVRNIGLFKMGLLYHNLESIFVYLSKSKNYEDFVVKHNKIIQFKQSIIELINYLHKNYLNNNFEPNLDTFHKTKALYSEIPNNNSFMIKDKSLSFMIERLIQNKMSHHELQSITQNILAITNELHNKINNNSLNEIELKFHFNKFLNHFEHGLNKMKNNIFKQSKNIDNVVDSFLQVRLVPVANYSDTFYETIRLASSHQNKKCELEIIGEYVQVDKQIMDSLSFAISHLLRNAVIHGIEDELTRLNKGKSAIGKIKLEFQKIDKFLSIVISDDGNGIDIEKVKKTAMQKLPHINTEKFNTNDWLNLIFMSGFTTRNIIDEFAGRGVGLESVKKTLIDFNGQISVENQQNSGSKFKINLPINNFLSNFIIVENNHKLYAIPQYLIDSILTIRKDFYQNHIHNKEFVNLSDILFKISNKKFDMPECNQTQCTTLSQLLNEKNPINYTDNEKQTIIILNYLGERIVLVVNDVYQKVEGIIENLGSLQNINGVLGAIHSYDNKTALVINPILLLNNFNKELNDDVKSKSQHGYALIVDDSKMACLTTQHSLRKMNVQAISKEDGQTAYDFLINTTQLPNIILTDYEMPNMNGMELSRLIKQNDKLKHIPIIMITSKSLETYAKEAKDIGIEHIFGKPFNEIQLQAIMKKHQLC